MINVNAIQDKTTQHCRMLMVDCRNTHNMWYAWHTRMWQVIAKSTEEFVYLWKGDKTSQKWNVNSITTGDYNVVVGEDSRAHSVGGRAAARLTQNRELRQIILEEKDYAIVLAVWQQSPASVTTDVGPQGINSSGTCNDAAESTENRSVKLT